MSLPIFLPINKQVSKESGWSDYHNAYDDIKLQHKLKDMSQETDILKQLLPKSGTILDIGCGSGIFLRYFKEHGNYVMHGLDFSKDALCNIHGNNKAHLTQASATTLPYQDSCFDILISLGVIEHFQKGPQEAILECFRVLKPGGLLFCTVPFANIIRSITYPIYRALYPLIFGKTKEFIEYRFSRKELLLFFRQAGFSINGTYLIDLKPFNFSIFWAMDFGRLFKKKNSSSLYELNLAGTVLHSICRPFPLLDAAGILIAARRPK